MSENKGNAHKKRKKGARAAGTDLPWTMELTEFGRRYYGLNRGGSYDAANKGLIPVIRVGRRWRGLTRVAERQLAGETTD